MSDNAFVGITVGFRTEAEISLNPALLKPQAKQLPATDSNPPNDRAKCFSAKHAK